MGQITNYTEKKILDHILKTASYSPETTVYLGLSTADPTHDGSGWADPTYTGYGRKPIVFNAAGATVARAIIQNSAVNFDPCSSGTSLVTHWGLWDAETAGHLLAYGAFSVGKTIVAGNTPAVPDTGIQISVNAGSLFTAFVHSVLDWLFRAQALAQPTHVKIGLSTTTPTDGGTNITEPGNNYAQVEFDTWNAAAGNPEAAKNNGAILMPTPNGTWGLITYGVLYLDTTKAAYGTVPNQTPDNGDTVEWLDQQFSFSIQ